MEYLQSIGAQTAIFLRTVGFGFLLGAVYDLLRFVRLLSNARRIAVWDIGFGAFAGVATFLFALTQDGGRVRLYLLAAIGLGFGVWYFCAGRPVRTAADGIAGAGRRWTVRVRRRFSSLENRFGKTWDALAAFMKKSIKKFQKKRKSS